MRRPGGFDGSAAGPDPAPARVPAAAPESAQPSASPPVSPPVSPASRPASSPVLPPVSRPASASVSAGVSASVQAGAGVQRAREELRRASRERRSSERQQRQRFTAHRRLRRRRWIIAAAAVLGLALIVAVAVFTPIMAVRDIQVQGASAVNTEELQQALARFEGEPLALVSDREVHRAVEPFPLIQRYAVERIPPHTLVVRIEERSAAIALEREGGFELLDPAGVQLGHVAERPAGVPLADAELADTASPAFLAAARIVRDMPADLRQQLVSVRASSAQDVSFVLDSGTEVFWGEAKDTQRKSVVLRSLLASIGTPGMVDVSAPDAPVFK